jgi:hypothetical protein
VQPIAILDFIDVLALHLHVQNAPLQSRKLELHEEAVIFFGAQQHVEFGLDGELLMLCDAIHWHPPVPLSGL